MRESWDFVTMDTYSADMAELSRTAAGVTETLARENRALKALVWELVRQAGGKVMVSDHALMPDPKHVLEVSFDMCHDARVYRARGAVEQSTPVAKEG
jgi:hypothetical protein